MLHKIKNNDLDLNSIEPANALATLHRRSGRIHKRLTPDVWILARAFIGKLKTLSRIRLRNASCLCEVDVPAFLPGDTNVNHAERDGIISAFLLIGFCQEEAPFTLGVSTGHEELPLFRTVHM